MDGLTARRRQGVELKSKVLVIRGDTGIADHHALDYARAFSRDPDFYFSEACREAETPLKNGRYR